MPGPPPNPNSGRSRKRGLTVITANKDGDYPAPPAEYAIPVKRAWVAFWTSPIAQHVIESDQPALRRLFSYYDRRERFDREGMVEPVVSGSTGQQALHPLLREVDTLDAKILALEDRFGMSPMARLKLQVQIGDASRSISETNARLASAGVESDEDEQPDPRVQAAR